MDYSKEADENVFSRLLDPGIQTNPFGHNRSGERAYRRAERIVGAIILLTNHVPPDDELRRSSRLIALAILDGILNLKYELRSTSSAKALELQASIRQLISLIRMMVFAAFVSIQNAEITIAAAEDLNTLLSASARSGLSDALRLSKEDFSDVRGEYKGHIKDIKDKRYVKGRASLKDTFGATVRIDTESSENNMLSTRSQGIITILKTGGELNLPDIAANLPEYGEKTIQRELGTLIARGIVRRSGLKRWSKYALSS